MDSFTPASALNRGPRHRCRPVLLMLTLGRIAGVSGIVGALLRPDQGDIAWRVAFVAGLVAGPALWCALGGFVPPVEIDASLPVILAGGLLVGAGTRLGGGCTSGHGVCGLARLSPRSLWATANERTFLSWGRTVAIVFPLQRRTRQSRLTCSVTAARPRLLPMQRH